MPGTVIAGKYRIDGLIGRGGMGTVWSAMHLGLGQRVAVKLIARRYASSREARQRFDLEAKAAAQLRSRFVVQVYDNGETDDGTPYIVMELLVGESLDQRIQRGPLALDAAVRIVSQVARALTRAHGLGIVHRDLKPENIFLTHTEDDDGEVAKVLDFGIAKIKPPEGSDSATRTGAVLGSPLFMSPEQARGLKSVDHRTDIYSLGMVTYTMLTGQSAFSGESFGDILVAICTQPLPSFRTIAPALPSGLDGWFARACAREPEARYSSIEQVLEGLYAAAGISRPNLKAQEVLRSDSSGTGQTPVRVGATVTDAALAAPGHATNAALTVTGEDIPRRSMVIPVVLAGALVAAIAVVALVALRKPAELAASGGGAVLAFTGSAPAPGTASAPTPAAAPSASQATAASAENRGAPQKAATPARPSGNVGKGIAKIPDTKPPPSKTKPPPDLGF